VVAGEVRDVPALAEALESFFTENKLPRKGIRLGIGTNRIGVRSLDVEGIDDVRQLGNAVRFRAHEALAIPMDEAVLDYHVTGETVTESGGISRRVLLAAAYREPIDHYIEAFRSARLELVGIDVEAFALLRAVAPTRAADPDAAPSAVVAVALGHDRSTLAISDGTVCDFMRVLEWGGGKLDAAISRALGLTLEEASEIKNQLSL
jgi:type IV pilus assembly protein PilM